MARLCEDLHSFESFYRLEYRSVLGLAIVLSGNVAAAEEITEEAFVAVFRRWDHVESGGQPIPKLPDTGNQFDPAPVHMNCESALPWISVWRK